MFSLSVQKTDPMFMYVFSLHKTLTKQPIKRNKQKKTREKLGPTVELSCNETYSQTERKVREKKMKVYRCLRNKERVNSVMKFNNVAQCNSFND